LIRNRHLLPLDAVENLAEAGDYSRRCQFAIETRNWPLLAVLRELADELRQNRKKRRPENAAQGRV